MGDLKLLCSHSLRILRLQKLAQGESVDAKAIERELASRGHVVDGRHV